MSSSNKTRGRQITGICQGALEGCFDMIKLLPAFESDYLGDTPMLGVEFKVMFRLSRGHFQVLMEDVMAPNISFFKSNVRNGVDKSSLAARLLLPLKSLAYGVPPHTFIDYFQMSPQYTRDCCKEFDKAMRSIYMKEFLRLPTATDLKNIVKLHKLTTFPQSWLSTLLYSYAMNGNGHVIIRRHGHIREQYDQGDIEYVSLCLYVGVPVFDPGHHTMAQCCSNFIRKDASVSTHNF
jgi:hypothetical protein